MKIIIGTYRADEEMILRCTQSIIDHSESWVDFIFVDDSGDVDFQRWLHAWHGQVYAVDKVNVGYAKAMQKVCEVMRDVVADDYVVFWEEDFVATGPLQFDCMRTELKLDPKLAQIVFPRQPWFPNEIEAGSMLDALATRRSGDYLRVPTFCDPERLLLKHQMTFSCNPAMWAPLAYRWGWPQCGDSEDAKTEYLLSDDDACFAFWGDQVLVHHDGERQGHGY